MLRRKFIENLGRLPVFALGAITFGQLASNKAFGCEDAPATNEGIKSFGFYQGLTANEARSASRTDGTFYNMPCIAKADIEAGLDKTYEFWHGHNGKIHKFTVTADNFASLVNNQSIEIYTNLVDNHRHALKISPDLVCTIGS